MKLTISNNLRLPTSLSRVSSTSFTGLSLRGTRKRVMDISKESAHEVIESSLRCSGDDLGSRADFEKTSERHHIQKDKRGKSFSDKEKNHYGLTDAD